MHPYLFEIPLPWGGTYRAASYGVMIVIGFLLCLWLLRRRGRRMGLNPLVLYDMAILILLCGIVGARLFYVIDNWQSGGFDKDPWLIIRIDKGGLAFFGGLAGGIGALWYMVKTRGLSLLPTLDVGASLVPLGHAFGRMGCFLFGCCYGKVTDAWTGVCFPRGSPAYLHQLAEKQIRADATRSLPVHPTQLYELTFNLFFFGLLSWLLWRRRRPGQIAWAYLTGYGCWRFFNEFFRDDTGELVGPFTIFHLIAAGTAIVGIALLIRTFHQEPVPLPEPWQPPPEKDEKEKSRKNGETQGQDEEQKQGQGKKKQGKKGREKKTDAAQESSD